MKTSMLEFPFPSRRVFTACKDALQSCGQFRSIKCDDKIFRIIASKGLPIFGEDVSINVIATTSTTCEVAMKSSDKLFFNPFKVGNNVRIVKDLDQYIRNEVFRLCNTGELRISSNDISILSPSISFRK